MFESLLLHPKTKKSLERFADAPAHAVILIGPVGAGKTTLGHALAAQILSIEPSALDNYPYFMQIRRQKDKQDISIEAIREVNQALRLQVPGSAVLRRVILLQDAHHMNQEAQNAFLKSLEEPPADTVFILTSTAKASLLPTIISRAQSIVVHPVSLEHLPNSDEPAVKSAWQLSQGAVGLFSSLLKDEDEDLKTAVDQAKRFLQKTPYERLIELDSLSRDKERLNLLLDGLARVMQALYKAAARKDNKKQVANLLAAMKTVGQARQDLDTNVLSRLIALRLAVNLSI